MTFVSVPVVSRERPDATTARRLLIAAHETTEEQFTDFRRVSNRPPFTRGNAVGVSATQMNWAEAVAFCDWLTQKERGEGLIRQDQQYRLPTDHEWSCAAGIGHLEQPSKTPEAKSNQIPGHFPWGTIWPPPRGAGNLCGTEAKAAFPDNFIAGYRDAYSGLQSETQASAANEHGLYDLSGNLWEWCADRFREGTDWRVLRGGSWKSARPQTLLSSHRTHDPETYRSDSVGFRCVLASE